MSSASRRISGLFLAAATACLGGCRSATNPPPAAAGSRPAVLAASGAAGLPAYLDAVNPVAHDPVSAQDGRRLFLWYNCYACHGPYGGGAIGPSLRDRRWRYGGSDGDIFASIAQGRPHGMPTWGGKIPQIQIWELVAYIRTLGTPAEPDPPQEPAIERSSDPRPSASAPAATLLTFAGRH